MFVPAAFYVNVLLITKCYHFHIRSLWNKLHFQLFQCTLVHLGDVPYHFQISYTS